MVTKPAEPNFNLQPPTMTFINSIAGPSRQTLRASATHIITRSAATATPTPTSTEDPVLEDPDAKRAKAQEKAFWESENGYKSFLTKVATPYRAVAKGQKAKWLGGNIVSHLVIARSDNSHTQQILLFDHLLHSRMICKACCTNS